MQINNIIVHHSGGTDANPLQDSSNYTVDECNQDHKIRFNMLSSLGWYVGYTYFIDKAGVVTQTRKDGEEGAHTIGHNSDSIGICLAGNFDLTLPTDAQIKSLTILMASKVAEFNIPLSAIVPHRHFATKTCYGKRLADNWASSLLGSPSIHTPTYSPVTIGEIGDNVKNIQDLLIKKGFGITPMNSGTYDENMAKNVLTFQIANKVAEAPELGSLRGERVGAKTLTALLQ